MKNHLKTGIIIGLITVVGVIGYSIPERKPNRDNLTKEVRMEHLTLNSFQEKICECGLGSTAGTAQWNYKGDLPAVIDFYADWCGPCKMVSPILEELSKEYEGRLNIYKIYTEQQQQLAAMFGIRSIPSILFIPVEGQPQEPATLVLRVEGPTALEIQHSSDQILERVNRFFGWHAVGRLALRQAPLSRRAPPPRRRAPDAKTVADEEKTLTAVEDDDLRAALARLGASIKRN